jgi:Domain of unknown function (DUF1707)
VSELPISSPYRSRPDAPVSEEERNQLSRRLNDAFTEGRMDADEYNARLDALFAARRLGDLVPVVEGLPPLQTYQNPANLTPSTGEPGQLSAGRSGTGLALVMVGVLSGVVLLLAVLLVILF